MEVLPGLEVAFAVELDRQLAAARSRHVRSAAVDAGLLSITARWMPAPSATVITMETARPGHGPTRYSVLCPRSPG